MNNIKPILFCDFDGVLCHDRYWRNLLPDEYEKIDKLLFRNNTTLVNDWMRGKYSAEEINRIVSEKTAIPFEKLWNVFVEDCKTMQVPRGTLKTLDRLRNRYIVILITGNMDSFSRFTQPALALENYFDHISNSFHEGMYKTDNNGEIFLKYTNKYGVPIQNCIVLDNSKNVCKIFTELGGIAYLITQDQNIIYYLEKIADQDGSVEHSKNSPDSS